MARWYLALSLGALLVGCGKKEHVIIDDDLDFANAARHDMAADLAIDDFGFLPHDLTVAAPHDLAIDPLADLKTSPPPPSAKWSMGYYAGYEYAAYPTSAIGWDGLTHLAVAFYYPNDDGSLDKTAFQNNATEGQAMAKALAKAAHDIGKKALISIGGENKGAHFLAAASDATRATFVANLVKCLDSANEGFDGIDLDWEPLDATDATTVGLAKKLVADLRKAAPTAILTMPIGYTNPNTPSDLSLFAALAPSLDQENIMSYGMAIDMYGWKSWHSSALYFSGDVLAPSSIKASVDAYVAAGVPKAKLGVGAGFYGLCYSPGVNGPDQTLNGSTIAKEDSNMPYNLIVSTYETGHASAAKWDSTAHVPYLSFDIATGVSGCSYISYENSQSLTDKAQYIKDQELGGLIIWTINQGYFSAAAAGQKNPLLTTIGTSLLQ